MTCKGEAGATAVVISDVANAGTHAKKLHVPPPRADIPDDEEEDEKRGQLKNWRPFDTKMQRHTYNDNRVSQTNFQEGCANF